MPPYSFEKLDVWQKAKEFTVMIYTITSEFPNSEKFGLISQLRRAAVSVSSNIAEGSTRRSMKDQGRFYVMAYGSVVEMLNQLIISKELGYLGDVEYQKLRNEIEQLTAMINSLHKATLA